MKKDVVIGLGEIGLPIYKILSKHFPVEGIDIDPILNKEKPLNSEESFKKEQKPDTRKIINIDLSDEEIDKHREYVNKITNPIWEGE